VDHGDVAEDTIDIDIHLAFGEVLDEFHVAVSNGVHERVPVVGRVELVDEMGEGIEEIDNLLGLALLCLNVSVPIQQKILLT
jgi:hypothetical protein